MAVARWVLPVPVPPTKMILRFCSMNSPAYRLRILFFAAGEMFELEAIDVLGDREAGLGHAIAGSCELAAR